MFDIAEEVGFQFNLLDIGGGFPGQKSAKLTFEEVCILIRLFWFLLWDKTIVFNKTCLLSNAVSIGVNALPFAWRNIETIDLTSNLLHWLTVDGLQCFYNIETHSWQLVITNQRQEVSITRKESKDLEFWFWTYYVDNVCWFLIVPSCDNVVFVVLVLLSYFTLCILDFSGLVTVVKFLWLTHCTDLRCAEAGLGSLLPRFKRRAHHRRARPLLCGLSIYARCQRHRLPCPQKRRCQ